MIEVLAGTIEKEGKILIARRKGKKHLSGFWEFPGGKLEKGENDLACRSREIKKDMGVRIKIIKHFMNNTHVFGDKEKFYSF